MTFLGSEPEKSGQAILEADSAEELLEEGYDESDLRRDWYLDSRLRSGEEFFQEDGVSGIELELDDERYRVIGVVHGIADTGLSPEQEIRRNIRDYVTHRMDEGENVLYEQDLDSMFELEGAKEMDDKGWLVEELGDRGVDYAEWRADRNEKLQNYAPWVKVIGKSLAYGVATRLGSEGVIARSSTLRDGEMFVETIQSMIDSDHMRRSQSVLRRNQLPEPLEGELAEDEVEAFRVSGRSERMAENALATEGDVSMLVGGYHMFQISHYLDSSSPVESIEKSEVDIQEWREEELKPRMEGVK